MRRLIFLLLVGYCVTFAQQTIPKPQSSKQRTEAVEDSGSGEDLHCPLGRNKTAETRFADYVISTYRWPQPEACLRISKHGKLVYSLESAEFKIGGNFFHDAGIQIGTDITGEGIPNAIVGEWSGGAHCCFTLHVFELGQGFKEIAKIEADNSDGAKFVDLDHDGKYEFEGADSVFAYWGTSFMQSPAPRIVLKYRQGRFRLAPDLMTKPAPAPDEFARIVRVVRTDQEWDGGVPDWLCEPECDVPVSLWKNMLDFLYTGHADFAWRLLDETWPPKEKAKIRGWTLSTVETQSLLGRFARLDRSLPRPLP